MRVELQISMVDHFFRVNSREILRNFLKYKAPNAKLEKYTLFRLCTEGTKNYSVNKIEEQYGILEGNSCFDSPICSENFNPKILPLWEIEENLILKLKLLLTQWRRQERGLPKFYNVWIWCEGLQANVYGYFHKHPGCISFWIREFDLEDRSLTSKAGPMLKFARYCKRAGVKFTGFSRHIVDETDRTLLVAGGLHELSYGRVLHNQESGRMFENYRVVEWSQHQ